MEARHRRDLVGLRRVALRAPASVDVDVDVSGHEPSIAQLDQLARSVRDLADRDDPAVFHCDLSGDGSCGTDDPLAAESHGYAARVTSR